MRKELVVAMSVSALLLCVLCAVFAGTKGTRKVKPTPHDSGDAAVNALKAQMEQLRPLHTRMGKPQPGDWLLSHPECVAKVWYATGCDPIARYQSLVQFCRTQELTQEQEAHEKALKTLERGSSPKGP